MRVILAGQRSFGLAAYRAILGEGHEIVAVWSPLQYDGTWTDPLTRVAREVELLQLTSERAPEIVRELGADLFVAAHSHDFISRKAREATRLGGIGYHPSLLPRHRGRDAVEWTVRMGDPVAGGSVYWLTDNVDGGPIAAQDWCFVKPGWSASDLWRNRLFPMGIWLLTKTLHDLDRGVLVEVPQDEDVATWEPSIDRPPLFRPDLPQIGTGPAGFEVRTTREALR